VLEVVAHWSTTITAQLSSASRVEAPRCGSAITRVAVEGSAREVADVLAEPVGGERVEHRAVADHALAAEVQEHRAGPHQADVGVVDEVARGLEQRHVQGHELAPA
jgi:hypothetical protein